MIVCPCTDHCEKGLRPYVFSPPGKQLNVPQPGFSPLLIFDLRVQLQLVQNVHIIHSNIMIIYLSFSSQAVHFDLTTRYS